MPIIPFQARNPEVNETSWVAPDAWVIGNTKIAAEVSVFFGAVLRGDILPISVGAGTNIQEGALLHTSTGMTPCVVGANVTVGHRAIIHGCSVRDNCIIGMGATILDGATIEEDCIIGANSLVTMGTIIPRGSLALGSPARVVRQLTAEEKVHIRQSAQHYRQLGSTYRQSFGTIATTPQN